MSVIKAQSMLLKLLVLSINITWFASDSSLGIQLMDFELCKSKLTVTLLRNVIYICFCVVSGYFF